ncbi:glycosyltransferase family 9 protein [Streptomyces albus]|uniref:glycosyltransferase family 9 protein n=1 Tax=Streptomyces TaxID=1883 RepID=UPI00034E81B6|nr:hypothetical protein HMPREF1486_02179 [Streptomyces sp. HPH0547]GHJ22055.1 transferase [Streptomyces albus]
MTPERPGPDIGRHAGHRVGHHAGRRTDRHGGPETGKHTGQCTGPVSSHHTGLDVGRGTDPDAGRSPSPGPGTGTNPDAGRSPGPGTGRRTGQGPGQHTGPDPGRGTEHHTGREAGPGTGPRTDGHTGPATGRYAGHRTGQRAGHRTGQHTGPGPAQHTGHHTGPNANPGTGQRTDNHTSHHTTQDTSHHTTPAGVAEAPESLPLPLRAGAGAGADRPRTLVLRALGLGDLLTAVPALRALRRTYPGHELVLAAPRWLAEVARDAEVADVLLPAEAPGREVPAVRWPWPVPPRLAVDLHGNGPASRTALAATAPVRLLAYADGSGPRWRPDEHERDRWCRLLSWYGVPADPGDLLVRRPRAASPAPGAVLLHPGADAAARRWPPGRFAEVARALRSRGVRVVVTHGPGEHALAHEVAGRAGLPSDAVPGGRAGLPFAVLAALVAEARAVIVGDTGVAHLASALATPSVVLFGPVSPALWGPPAHPRHRALWHPDPGGGPRPGDPHGARPDARLLRITPAEVLDGWAALPPPGAPVVADGAGARGGAPWAPHAAGHAVRPDVVA